jgi:hypothetical protein
MGDISVRLLADHWFGELGCTPSDLTVSRPTISSHGTSLIRYPGIIIFRQNSGCAISVPKNLQFEMKMKFSAVKIEDVFNPKILSNIFTDDVERMIGPAWIG